jgi:hypothetical protein
VAARSDSAAVAARAAAVARGVVVVRAGRLRAAGRAPPLAGFARELAAALGFFAPDARADPDDFADPDAADPDFGGADADAARFGRCAAVAADLGLAAARAFARAGVSLAAAAAGASGGVAPRAGRSRLALRREGRVRGRLVSTSRSLRFDPESLGGMARFLPILSWSAPHPPRLGTRLSFRRGSGGYSGWQPARSNRGGRSAIS